MNYLNKIKSDSKSIEFIPTLTKIEMYEYFSKSTFFILPSLTTSYWIEQFGLTLAEAMASEKCLALGSSSGAIPEVMNFKKCIFKENSVLSLSNLIIYFIKNKIEREKLSRQQAAFSRENYSFKSISNLYGKTIKDILERN